MNFTVLNNFFSKFSKKKVILFFFLFFLLFAFSILFAPFITYVTLRNDISNLNMESLFSMYAKSITYKIFICLIILDLTLSSTALLNLNWYRTNQVKITSDICIPIATGQNQYGSAKFADKNEYDNIFSFIEINISDEKEILESSKKVFDYIEENKGRIDNQIQNQGEID